MATDEDTRAVADDAPVTSERPARAGRRRGARRATDDAPASTSASAPAGGKRKAPPSFWHRDHPVFTPLSAFFTGMALAIVVPGVFGAVLRAVVGDDDQAAKLFPLALLVLLVPVSLLVRPGTRRFGRYMLVGVVFTLLVVVVSIGVTLWYLINHD